jgi:hypothetical protein
MVRANPGHLHDGRLSRENIVMAKDLFRADYKGKVMGFAYGITPAFIDGAGKEGRRGHLLDRRPVAAFDSSAYAKLKALVKRDTLDTFSARPTTTPIWRSSRWPRARMRRHRHPRQHPQDLEQRQRHGRSTTRSTG